MTLLAPGDGGATSHGPGGRDSTDLALIVLTRDEEVNIAACLESVRGLAREIFVVDSGSTDNTVGIAQALGAKVVEHPFTTQAEQFNWALDNLPITAEWILRLDADERLLPELREEIRETLPLVETAVCGLYMKYRMIFLGRWIRHGAYYPTWLLRLFRRGKARSEQAEMNEHVILLEGRGASLSRDFLHEDAKGLSSWLLKHERYASRQANLILKTQSNYDSGLIPARLLGSQAQRKRWIIRNVYGRMPLFVRAFAYFFYRYVVRLGFLDGMPGLVFHFLQGCWYPFYTDARIYEDRLKR